MKYDIKGNVDSTLKPGFYVWNKATFFIKKNDNRYDDAVDYKKEHGFSLDETWDLRTNIALFLVPRLKAFKEVKAGYPSCFKNEKEWNKMLDKIIFAFESYLEDDFYVPEKYVKKYKDNARDKYWEDVQEGLNLFAQWYGSLWW